MAETRVYCDGQLTKTMLAAKLDEGFVLTDLVHRGYSGGDVAYFRAGTAEEIERLRRTLAVAPHPETPGGEP